MSLVRWLNRSRPLVIAHRGHCLELPENTLEAYRRAIELGAEMLEADVNLTADGHLVMLHDTTLDRTTSGSGRVSELRLSEVRRLDAGSWFGAGFEGLQVPTTDETIALAREAGILMCFEIKGDADDEAAAIADALIDLLVARDALAWACVSGYDHRALARAKRRAPEVILAPERLPDDEPADPSDALRQARALEAPILQNHHVFLTPDLVQTLHSGAVAVWAWPTTDPQSIVDSIALGADGVMGDDVAAMVRAVSAPPPSAS